MEGGQPESYFLIHLEIFAYSNSKLPLKLGESFKTVSFASVHIGI